MTRVHGRRGPADALPFVDEHRVALDVPRAAAWTALEEHARGLGLRPGSALARLLGTSPPSGFAVVEVSPGQRLVLAGHHHFSRYRWEFRVLMSAAGSEISARTYADFPGVHGRIYRALVITSRCHVVATRRVLRAIRTRAETPGDPSLPDRPPSG